MPEYIYGARDVVTKKLVSNITNPKRKYWDKRGNAVNAIEYHNNKNLKYKRYGEHDGKVELVKFQLVEVPLE